MAQILSFPKEYFIRDTQRPLTDLMVKTLELAYYKQKSGIEFGPKDIKGSVTPLIQRGLISSRTFKRDGELQLSWYVTDAAINMLNEIEQTA